MRRNTHRCRHRGTWLTTFFEWCYECGAFRRLTRTGPNSCQPASPWAYPVGVGGENPHADFTRRTAAYHARKL